MAIPEGKYAWTVTVGSKGQIVIPKEAREVFQIRPGDNLPLDQLFAQLFNDGEADHE